MNEVRMSSGEEYWGVCPECGSNDGYLNVGRAHWYVCHRHRVRWLIGTNLFSSWRDQTEEEWRLNAERIGPYEDVSTIVNGPPRGDSPPLTAVYMNSFGVSTTKRIDTSGGSKGCPWCDLDAQPAVVHDARPIMRDGEEVVFSTTWTKGDPGISPFPPPEAGSLVEGPEYCTVEARVHGFVGRACEAGIVRPDAALRAEVEARVRAEALAFLDERMRALRYEE